MENIKALREKISNLAKEAKQLIADKGDQKWAVEDQAKFDGITNEIEASKAAIRRDEQIREMEADKFFNSLEKPASKQDGVTIDALAAVAIYLRQGSNVTADQAVAIRNAMSTTTTTEGGFTVPTEVAAMVIDRMKAYGGMREAAEIITTESGNPLGFPGSDGTAETGEIVGENAAAATGEITFTNVTLNTFKYSSKKIALPVELIQDSAIDIIAFVVNRLATRIARKQNTDFTVGAGTTLPDGIVPKSTLGKTGITGQTLTVIYDDLFDLKHSVNRAYRANSKWMLNDLSVAVVSKLKETTGRPIWEPSILPGTPDTLLGYPVIINDDVAAMAASAKSIIFGDLSKYAIRDVANSTSLRRFDDSAFALNGQVGFCGWTRSGGNLLDVQAVKHYINSAT